MGLRLPVVHGKLALASKELAGKEIMFEVQITARVACPVCAGAVEGMSAAEMSAPGYVQVTDNDVADALAAAARVFDSVETVTAARSTVTATEHYAHSRHARVRCELCLELSDESLYFVLSGPARD